MSYAYALIDLLKEKLTVDNVYGVYKFKTSGLLIDSENLKMIEDGKIEVNSEAYERKFGNLPDQLIATIEKVSIDISNRTKNDVSYGLCIVDVYPAVPKPLVDIRAVESMLVDQEEKNKIDFIVECAEKLGYKVRNILGVTK